MAFAQRFITKEDGSQKILFNEKCICGNSPYKIEKDQPDYATCSQCLRVYRVMVLIVPEGIITIWGIYFDPYFANTLVGQFINQYIKPLDPERYPTDSPKGK